MIVLAGVGVFGLLLCALGLLADAGYLDRLVAWMERDE